MVPPVAAPPETEALRVVVEFRQTVPEPDITGASGFTSTEIFLFADTVLQKPPDVVSVSVTGVPDDDDAV
jgi:hypothetical protein